MTEKKQTRIYRFWSEEELKAAAQEFDTRTRFAQKNQPAYAAARRRGILDIVCAHMKPGDSNFRSGRPRKNAKRKKADEAA